MKLPSGIEFMNALHNNHVRIRVICVLLTALLAAGCTLPPSDRRSDPPGRTAAIQRNLLVPGEKLTYAIRTGQFSLGQAEFSIQASETSKDILHLNLFANSTHPWFPALSYTYKSTVRKSDFATLSFNMEQTEKSEIEKTVQFEAGYDKRAGDYSVVKRDVAQKGTVKIDETVYDYLSIIYLLRKSMPSTGEQLEVPVFHETGIVDIKVKNLTERDIVLNNTGRFSASILKPKRNFEDVFFRRGNILLWIDSTYRIPLRIVIKLPFGIGRIELIKAENTQTGDVFIP